MNILLDVTFICVAEWIYNVYQCICGLYYKSRTGLGVKCELVGN